MCILSCINSRKIFNAAPCASYITLNIYKVQKSDKMSFKKLNTKIYQKSGPIITPDYIYWKKLGVRKPLLQRYMLLLKFVTQISGSSTGQGIWCN